MQVQIPTNPEWKKIRQYYYDRWLLSNWQTEEYSKRHIKAIEAWYFEGDLTPLLTGKGKTFRYTLNLHFIMDYCPASSAQEYFRCLQEVSLWLSERKLCYWKDLSNSLYAYDKDERFTKSVMLGLFLHPSIGQPFEATTDIIKAVFNNPKSTELVLPFTLGNNNWQPKGRMHLPTFVESSVSRLCRYLFGNEEDIRDYKPLIALEEYILPNLHLIDERCFALTLSDDSAIEAGQQLTRAALAKLAGYNIYLPEGEKLPHNDPVFEKKLIDAFAKADMPESYHTLITFIHKHKEDCLDA